MLKLIPPSNGKLLRIEMKFPTEDQRRYLKSVMLNNYTPSNDYQARISTNAFLQCDHEDYIMIEFWSENMEAIERFVTYLNDGLGSLGV